MTVNRDQPGRLTSLLGRRLPDLANRRITVLGLAFKPHTDDIRESPALQVVTDLLEAGSIVTVHDPVALRQFHAQYNDQVIAQPNLEAALTGAEAVIVTTSWPEYEGLPALIARINPDAILVDGRRMFSSEDFVMYEGIGL